MLFMSFICIYNIGGHCVYGNQHYSQDTSKQAIRLNSFYWLLEHEINWVWWILWVCGTLTWIRLACLTSLLGTNIPYFRWKSVGNGKKCNFLHLQTLLLSVNLWAGCWYYIHISHVMLVSWLYKSEDHNNHSAPSQVGMKNKGSRNETINEQQHRSMLWILHLW